jgi:hypothetical protein
VTLDDAKNAVLRELNKGRSVDEELVLMEEHTIAKPYGWIFFYNSRRYVETRDFLHALEGNGPVVVERRTGRMTHLGTARPTDEVIADFEAQRLSDSAAAGIAWSARKRHCVSVAVQCPGLRCRDAPLLCRPIAPQRDSLELRLLLPQLREGGRVRRRRASRRSAGCVHRVRRLVGRSHSRSRASTNRGPRRAPHAVRPSAGRPARRGS